MTEHLRLLAHFNAWVNGRLYPLIAGLPGEVRDQPRGLAFGSLHRTLDHLLVVDRLWRCRVEGCAHGLHALDQILNDDIDDLLRARQREDGRLITLVDGLGEADLHRIVVYRRMIGEGDEEARVGPILQGLFNHQTHHRGQIHAVLTQSGLMPPPLDLIFFLEASGEAGPPGTLAR